MLKDVGNGFTKGSYLYFHDLGKLTPEHKTHRFEVCSRDSSSIIGYIKWFTQWRRYTFYPINCMLDASCMREIADFCDQITTDYKKDWKPRKNKFNKTYDMTNRNKTKGQMKLGLKAAKL
jgi:hypothetical protein